MSNVASAVLGTRAVENQGEAAMPKLRSELDADRQPEKGPTKHPTAENRHELLCPICGQKFYVDAVSLARASEAAKMGLDPPFRCPDCEEAESS